MMDSFYASNPRPQYGDPDTKPVWWPQHLLPWEDMKKMGGKKSEELSHKLHGDFKAVPSRGKISIHSSLNIFSTSAFLFTVKCFIYNVCLQGYENFGYDPVTYFSSDPEADGGIAMLVDESYIAEDGGGQFEANNQYESQARFGGVGEEEEPALEFDLDEEASPYGGVPPRDRGVLRFITMH